MKNKRQFNHNLTKAKRQREWDRQIYPTFGKTRNNIDNLFSKFMY